MPVIHVRTSAPVSDAQRDGLVRELGQLIGMVPGKSEQWLMCLVEGGVPMAMAGESEEPCAYVTVDVFARSAVPSEVWQAMTPRICDLLQTQVGVDPARTYVKYGWSPDFGWNGMNF